MFMDSRGPKHHPLFLWNNASCYRFYTKYAMTMLLSAIFIKTPATDFNVSHFATGLRQVGEPCYLTDFNVSHFATGLRQRDSSGQ